MKKYQMYIYGLAWIFLLIFIGRTGDKVLFWLMDYFKLSQMPHIDIYVLILSVLMLAGGCLLVLSIRNQKINKNVFLRIVTGSVIGGFGSVWLAAVLFRLWLDRCCN